jgi:hypothetical protein
LGLVRERFETVVVTAALAFMVGTAAPVQARSVDAIMAEAVKAREAGDLERVVTLLQEAYAVTPAPALLNNLARMYEQLGQYGDAYSAYKKVVDDPNAESDLRSLDSGRMAALRPKVARAWLDVHATPDGARVDIDGRPPLRDADGEIGVDPGSHIVQVTSADGETAQLIFGQWPAGRRTALAVDLSKPDPAHGSLTLDGGSVGLHALAVEGLAVAGDLFALRTIRLPARSYRLSGHRADGSRWSTRVKLTPGSAIAIAGVVPAPNTPPGGQGFSTLGGPETLTAAQAPRDETPIGAVTTLGVGVVSAGIGAWLMNGAQTARNNLKSELGQVNAQGQVIGVHESEAEQILSDADNQEMLGTLALALGGVAVGSGLVWWVLGSDENAPGRRSSDVTVSAWGSGVLVQGRF